MKVVIAGGSGFLGSALAKFYSSENHEVIILTRVSRGSSVRCKFVEWDGVTVGKWAEHLRDADILINLAGKSVNCRYNAVNKMEILESRVNSVKTLADALNLIQYQVPLWIQSSSATIYRHAEDRTMDEQSGELGKGFSVDVCTAWEKVFSEAYVPGTRKIILRTGIVLGRDGGAFPELLGLCRQGMGGTAGNGRQYISWLHLEDFIAIINWLHKHTGASGVYNCTAPFPIQNKFFMSQLRRIAGVRFSVQLPKWLLSIGARIKGTETELILKSRWVVPSRLLNEGFKFRYGNLHLALKSLVN